LDKKEIIEIQKDLKKKIEVKTEEKIKSDVIEIKTKKS
jgi:hypothetical protein